jgi:AcrR family transcriptional regulator
MVLKAMKCSDMGPARTRNAAATRHAMLVAAARRFLQDSYEAVGLRDIARDVGVDVALVSRYFGSKEELFHQVLRAEREEKLPLEGNSADIPSRLADIVLDKGCEADRENVDRLLIILRSASSPKAAEIVRDSLRHDVLEPFAELIQGPNASIRASFVLAIFMGTTILRTVMQVGPLCEEDREIVRRQLERLFETALSESGEPSRPVSSLATAKVP